MQLLETKLYRKNMAMTFTSCIKKAFQEPKIIVCSYHVTYAFQSESTLYSCLNVKELLARSRREIWNLIDCNWTRTHNYSVHKRTLNHSAKLASLAKWLSVRLWTLWCGFESSCSHLSQKESLLKSVTWKYPVIFLYKTKFFYLE